MEKKEFLQKFRASKPYLIGMVHLAPLAHSDNTPGFEAILENAKKDIEVLNTAGFDAILIENNYDSPHVEFLPSKSRDQFLKVSAELKNRTDLDIGLSVLWNDYKTALSVATEVGALFIRIPVFVGKIKTFYGFDVVGQPEKIKAYKQEIKAEEIALFTDIQVKHSIHIDERPIIEEAKEATLGGSDGLIITGEWTGDAPKILDLAEVKHSVATPIIVGSGSKTDNLERLKQFADSFIVGTSIKEGEERSKSEEINLKPWTDRVDLEKAKTFVRKAKEK